MAAAAAMPASRGWVFSNRELDKAVAAFQRGELLSKAQMAMLRAAADPLFFAKEFKRAPKLSNFEPPSKRNSVGWEAFTCADETGRVTMREHTTELPRVNIKGDLLGAYRTAPEQKRSGGSSGAGGSGSGGRDKLRPSASGPPTRMGVTVPEDAADAACRKCSLRLDLVQPWLCSWLRAAVRTQEGTCVPLRAQGEAVLSRQYRQEPEILRLDKYVSISILRPFDARPATC